MKRFRGKMLNIGCERDIQPHSVNIDSEPFKGVDVCCKPWEVSRYCRDSASIRSVHLLERLTYDEAVSSLRDWYDALKNTGTIHLVVSNIDHYLEKWQNLNWSIEAWRDAKSEIHESIAAIYGADSKVRRSGYNREALLFLFAQTKFFGIVVTESGADLIVTARRQLGERQVGSSLADIRADHRARYEYATTLLAKDARILDIACGVGYGSFILAEPPERKVEGVDISHESVAYAKTHYNRGNIEFLQSDAYLYNWPPAAFDAIVSFETLEHVPDPGDLLSKMSSSLTREGLLICSTPNEAVMPFSKKKFPHHVGHLTPEQFESLLMAKNLQIIARKSQLNKRQPELLDGWNGSYMIAVCKRIV